MQTRFPFCFSSSEQLEAVSYSPCIVNEKATALMTAHQALRAQVPTALPTSPPTVLLLAHFDPATKACFHPNLPDTFLSRAIAPGGSTAQNALA